MKKDFLLLLFVITSLSFLSACTSSDTTSTQATSPILASYPTVSSPVSESSRVPSRGGRHNTQVAAEVQSVSTGTVETHPDNTTTITKIITYRGPAGYIDTEFTLTRDSAGKITAITAEYRGNDHEDLMYHRRFNTSASKQIVGKKIQDLSFDAVGGASLTTDAFNKMIASL